MEFVVAAVLGLLAVYFFAQMAVSMRRRNHIISYVVYLLLEDELRDIHKADFLVWLRKRQEADPGRLWNASSFAIERMAEDLHRKPDIGSSSLGAPAILWQERENPGPNRPD